MTRFSDDEMRRYSRQILLREVGGRGQERLRDATVRLLGEGLVAETAARYLLRAGVGRLLLSTVSEAAAERLRQRLSDEGTLPCGPPLPTWGRPAWADPAVLRVMPVGVTVMRLEAGSITAAPAQAFLWARSQGDLGEVGGGCPCASRVGGGPRGEEDGPTGLGTGAALALEAVKLLLGQRDPFTAREGAGRRVFCLAQGPGQQPLWRDEARCTCPAWRSEWQPTPDWGIIPVE